MSVPCFAVIGGGIRGRSYAAAIRQHPGAELVAVCDPAPAQRATLADELGVPVHADLDELLAAHTELTAAVVATPDATHLAPVLACAERGLGLLIEKPLATDLAQAVTMARAVRQSGVHTMIAFENRWNPRFQTVHADLAASGGEVVNQVITLNDTIYVPTRMLSWASASTPGWFLFPHMLDLATWLGGGQPIEVVARGVRQHLPRLGVDTWDAITATFTMSDGSLATLSSQWVLPEGMPSVFDFRYELNTTAAAYRIEISDTGVTRYGDRGATALHAPPRDHRGRETGAIPAMIDDFVALITGTPLDLPDIEQGLMITAAIDACHQSLTDGQPRTIDVRPDGND